MQWRQAQVSPMFEQCCFSGGDSTSWVENREEKVVLGVGTLGGVSVRYLWNR